MHGFVRSAGSITFWTLATAVLVIGMVHPASWFKGLSTGAGFALICLGVLLAWGAGFIGREIAAGRITPKGERKFGEYHNSSAVEGLRSDGFVSMKYDFRPNAWELVNKHGVKARHGGGDGMEVLKTLGYVGLFIALIGLKVCAVSH